MKCEIKNRKCSYCKSEYKTDKVVSYLCSSCRDKAEKDLGDTTLSIYAKCEELGIIGISI